MRMKIYRASIWMFAICGWSFLRAQNQEIGRPDAIGCVLVGTRQDAAQVGASGMGLGAELFLQYRIAPKFYISAGAGILTATDDIFRMENQKTVFFPSLEMRVRYDILGGGRFQPFFYSGFQFYNAATTSLLEQQNSGQSYRGSLLAGLGFEYTFLSGNHSLYVAADGRYGCFPSADPMPIYWVAKAGICFRLGNEMRMDYQSGNGREPFFVTDEVASNTVVKKANPLDDTKSADFVELLMKMDRAESNIQRNSERSIEAENQIHQPEESSVESSLETATEVKKEKETLLFGEAYQNGLDKFYRAEHIDAKTTFEGLLSAHPKHELASNCCYWVGECIYALGRYAEAIDAFKKVLTYPSSHKFDDALLMKGQCYSKLGQKESALTSFRELLDRFPDSEYVPLARKYTNKK
ncbi:MAG: tetratricopeptide repeat protein [bacterium]